MDPPSPVWTLKRPEGRAPGTMSAVTGRPSFAGARAFTLIELLVVISIMGLLAGLTIPVLATVKRQQYVKTARAELEQVASALENYKAKYGAYPPANPAFNPAFNSLYYELSGVTNTTIGGNSSYLTLDGTQSITAANYKTAFGAGGVVNYNSAAKSDEDSGRAKDFLLSLRANRSGTATTPTGVLVTLLTTSVRGPDATYQPVGAVDVNPFRYCYPGTNNPGSYDLWVDLSIKGQTNRVSNWNRQPQIIK